MTYQFKNLVFEGGGVKGAAYVGAMQALDEAGVLDNIERICGTSAGAIRGQVQNEVTLSLHSRRVNGYPF